MEQANFDPQPIQTKSPLRFFALAGVLFIGITAVAAAVLLPGMKTTDDRSKATLASTCAATMTAPAALCGEKCLSNDDCSSGLSCVSSLCRNALNPASSTCATSSSPSTNPVMTRPPSTAFPSPPPGCVYQTVQCIQAPCDPVLVCSTPVPTPAVRHVVKFVFHSYQAGQTMAIDYLKDGAAIIDDKSTLIVYAGTWFKGDDSSPYGGTYAGTNVNGSSMSYSTSSTSVTVRPYRYYTRGGLDVYVDGVLKRSITDLATGSGWTDITITF